MLDRQVPTQQAVKTYVDGLSGVGGDFTIGGNLTVNGDTTTVSTTNTTVTDKLLELASGTSGAPSGDAGIIIERGSAPNVFIGWDESQDKIRFATTDATGESTGALTLSDAEVQFGMIQASRITTNEVIERAHIDAGYPSGTASIDLATNAVVYYTAGVAANWTFNMRGNGSTSLNQMMANGDSLTSAILVTNGGTAYYANGFQIDGANVTPKWSGGSAPTGGNTNSIDIYTYTIIKTGDASWEVLASQTQYA